MPRPRMSNGDRKLLREGARDRSYGQDYRASVVDRFGVWLSARQIYRYAGSLADKELGDFGCGYHAAFVRRVLPELKQAVVVDFALSPDLKGLPNLTAIEGILPDGAHAGAVVEPGHCALHLCSRTFMGPVNSASGVLAYCTTWRNVRFQCSVLARQTLSRVFGISAWVKPER